MKVLKFLVFLFFLQSCATKKHINKHQLPEGIKSATETTYSVQNNQKTLLQKRFMEFTKNGRIKTSKTFDGDSVLIEEIEKKLWFEKKSYPDKEPYYCKTRWKPNERERISCYTQKQYKKNEAIYYYNEDGTINKIEDNFTDFNTHYYIYYNKVLTKIIVRNKEGEIIEEILIKCIDKDTNGACIKINQTFTFSNQKKEIIFSPVYFKNKH